MPAPKKPSSKSTESKSKLSPEERAFYARAEKQGYINMMGVKVPLKHPVIGRMSAEDTSALRHLGGYSSQQARKKGPDALSAREKFKKEHERLYKKYNPTSKKK